MIMVKDDYQIYLRIKSSSLQCVILTYFILAFFCWEPFVPAETEKRQTEKK